MERINKNNNRGGNKGGYRGGRNNNNGGGGRGGNGRGGGNRNHPQQYQEHHGSGRGCSRVPQTQQTPVSPRQTVDRVPDRVDSGRGGMTWSRIASGQPIGSTSVAQNQNRSGENPRQNVDPVDSGRQGMTWSRVASGQPIGSTSVAQIQNRTDPQALKVPNLESLSVSEHSKKDEVTNTYVPIKRPDRGTLATRTVKLLVNHFPVKFNPSKSILRYNVDVKQEAEQDASSSSRRPLKKSIPKSSLRMIQEKLCSEYPDRFPLLQTGYDGEKNLFSAISLPPGTYRVELSGRVYSCTIKYGNELHFLKLEDFLKGNAVHIPRDVLQALDVAMKAHQYREKVPVGRGMYPREHRAEDDLGCGVAAYRGSQQSLKVTENGLVMCTDYSVVPFRKRIPVLDFLKQHVKEIRVPDDIPRFRNQVMSALKGVRVTVTHRRTNQKYTVSGLSENPTRDISFEKEDPEGIKKPEVVKLTSYFREKWGKEIMHTRIPCLQLGIGKRANFVPMEFCVLAEDRRFPKEKLGKEAERRLKDMSLLPPDHRKNEICGMVRDEYATGRPGANVIQNFGVGVGMNMTEVVGRVLEAPKLQLGSSSGKPSIITVDKQKCQYNLLQGRTLVAGKTVERWALIDFSTKHRWNRIDLNNFIPKLMNRCGSIGVQMKQPLLVEPTDPSHLENVNSVGELLGWVVEECRKKDKGCLQLIICVMPEKHDGYKNLKWVSEVKIGVMTQCCLSVNANKPNCDQFLANLGLKINAKLGGLNMELFEKFLPFSKDDHFMFIGADVNHPAPLNASSPSIAAVVGSVNWPAATRYAARVRPQAHRKEEIINFGSFCLDLVNTYAKVNGVKPNKIVVYRDGVSDDQFDMVLNKEMVDMREAFCTENYYPLVTFVVAQKRHTTRLFLNNPRESGNVPPGTVVDTNIVHPTYFDFYLCSHFGGIGTSKPTRYSMIWDENRFSSDEIQILSYDLCYTFARCTKPVSLVTPVYYADLVAFRGRMFQEVLMDMEADSRSRSVSSYDQLLYNLDQSLKDSMFFI